jgi:cell fate (sporulation/competence/biofilm development) regulator YlbF (YheA/YmcA/DUF963 family)
MAKKEPPKKSRDPEEYKRFLETAKQVGADESAQAFDRAFKKVVPSAKPTKRDPS